MPDEGALFFKKRAPFLFSLYSLFSMYTFGDDILVIIFVPIILQRKIIDVFISFCIWI